LPPPVGISTRASPPSQRRTQVGGQRGRRECQGFGDRVRARSTAQHRREQPGRDTRRIARNRIVVGHAHRRVDAVEQHLARDAALHCSGHECRQAGQRGQLVVIDTGRLRIAALRIRAHQADQGEAGRAIDVSDVRTPRPEVAQELALIFGAIESAIAGREMAQHQAAVFAIAGKFAGALGAMREITLAIAIVRGVRFEEGDVAARGDLRQARWLVEPVQSEAGGIGDECAEHGAGNRVQVGVPEISGRTGP
jgi:hypothetical protein